MVFWKNTCRRYCKPCLVAGIRSKRSLFATEGMVYITAAGALPPNWGTMSASTALLNRLRDLTVARPRPRTVCYGLTVITVAVIAFAQAAMFGSSAPWFFYTPAVVLLALFLGRGPGNVATILSAIGAGAVVTPG